MIGGDVYMEERTYTFYEICKKLYSLDLASTKFDMNEFEKFRNWKYIQYNRLKEKSGIPKYPHKDGDGILRFSKDKYIEILFSLYYFDEPFFKNIRLLNNYNYEDVKMINDIFIKFIQEHFSDELTPEEIKKHIQVFAAATRLDEETAFLNLRELSKKYRKQINAMITWFHPTLNKESKKKIKAINENTSKVAALDELSSILAKYRLSYDDIKAPKESSDTFPFFISHFDRVYLIEEYVKSVVKLLRISDTIATKRQLLLLNEEFKQITYYFCEIRNTEHDDLIHDLFSNDWPEDQYDDFLRSKIKPSQEIYKEARDEYSDTKSHRSIPEEIPEKDMKELENFIKEYKEKRN